MTFDPCNRRVASESEDHLKRKTDVRRQVGVTARGILGNLPVGASTQTWLNGLKTSSPGVSTLSSGAAPQLFSSGQLQCSRRSCGGRCVRQGLTLSHRLSLTLSHFEATCLQAGPVGGLAPPTTTVARQNCGGCWHAATRSSNLHRRDPHQVKDARPHVILV